MFVGNWQTEYNYVKGNIVYESTSNQYYACCEDHCSSELVIPNAEDIYWVKIDRDFLNSFSENDALTTKNRPMRRRRMRSLDYPQSPFQVIPEESIEINARSSKLKRKLEAEERNVEEFKKKKTSNAVEKLRDQILLLDLDVGTKSFLVDKHDNTCAMTGTDYSKGMNWLKTVLSIPHGKYKEMSIKKGDSIECIKKFFASVKEKLDKHIYGLEDVKQEILEFIARKVTNPQGKGEVLALCGQKGVGKTKIIRSLAEALELPFCQINCGGCNDVAVLTGHSETYVGSKAGKIVEALQSSQYMNPIIYLDEIDKLSETKSREINGVLTHLLDEEQNNHFQDNYLSNVPLDLSKVFFVLSFNDLSKVDEIVSDRMKILYIEKPTLEEKVLICQQKVIPEIIESMKFDFVVNIDKEVIEYIVVHKCEIESGIRQLRKCIEKVLYKLNYDVLVGGVSELKFEKDVCVVTTHYVDKCLVKQNREQSFMSMYI
jgi:ATP-dependent Lon protease